MINSKHTISFVLDDKIAEIDFSKNKDLSPTTTVLNYLRFLPNHKGVKEGCSEGDCGACTVVLAELNKNNKLSYKSVTSCMIFLPMLNGKQLITVENIANKKGNNIELHPVQKLIVETNGTQCGYCTPGVIMSLFALYKNHNNPSREIIEDSLTGNLCRCTGYRPIIEAASKSCIFNGIDHFSEKESNVIEILKKINSDENTISIITEKQKYFHAITLNDALLLKKQYLDAIIVNGATDVALRQNKNHELLSEIIDISGIKELQTYSEDDENIYLGSGLKMEKIKSIVENKLPAFFNILKVFGSLQIRNAATLGGNIGSASPIGDSLPLLLAYKAKIKLKSIDKERIINISDFIKAYRTTDIKPDEIIYSVIIPKLKKDVIIRSYKISKRKNLDISSVSAGFRLLLNIDKTVKEIILAYGAMAATTKRAAATENFLINKKWERQTVEKAMEILYNEFEPLSDARSSEQGRKIAARNLLLKFYIETNNN